MLIVNADDFGASPRTSDPIIGLFCERIISSASAMVRMRDSARAASLARERSIPVGLHLNLTLPFDDTAVPAATRERQRRLTEILGAESWREDGREKPGSRLLEDVISDQLERFRASFGEPTHLDGHHHVHVHPAVLEHLPDDLPIRPILSAPARADARAGARERRLRKRFRCPDLCFAFEHVHPSVGGNGLQALEHARRRTLEIMVHPQREPERTALMSADWRAALSTLTLGSYLDFARLEGEDAPLLRAGS
jgi:chitin disaccharide deacetylase